MQGTHFIELCGKRGVPLVFFHNTGRSSAPGATKAKACMMGAVACVQVGGAKTGMIGAVACVLVGGAKACMMGAVACVQVGGTKAKWLEASNQLLSMTPHC